MLMPMMVQTNEAVCTNYFFEVYGGCRPGYWISSGRRACLKSQWRGFLGSALITAEHLATLAMIIAAPSVTSLAAGPRSRQSR
jgi:hypothetical protein